MLVCGFYTKFGEKKINMYFTLFKYRKCYQYSLSFGKLYPVGISTITIIAIWAWSMTIEKI